MSTGRRKAPSRAHVQCPTACDGFVLAKRGCGASGVSHATVHYEAAAAECRRGVSSEGACPFSIQGVELQDIGHGSHSLTKSQSISVSHQLTFRGAQGSKCLSLRLPGNGFCHRPERMKRPTSHPSGSIISTTMVSNHPASAEVFL